MKGHMVWFVSSHSQFDEVVDPGENITPINDLSQGEGCPWIVADPSSAEDVGQLLNVVRQCSGELVPALVVVDDEVSAATAGAILRLTLDAQDCRFEAWNMDLVRGPNAVILVHRKDLPICEADLDQLLLYTHIRPHNEYFQPRYQLPRWARTGAMAGDAGALDVVPVCEQRWWSATGSPVLGRLPDHLTEAPPFWFPSVRIFGRVLADAVMATAPLVPLSGVAPWLVGAASELADDLRLTPTLSTPALATVYLGWLLVRLAPVDDADRSLVEEVISIHQGDAPTPMHDLYSLACDAAWSETCGSAGSMTLSHRLFAVACAPRSRFERSSPAIDPSELLFRVHQLESTLNSGYLDDVRSAFPRHREAILLALDTVRDLLRDLEDPSDGAMRL